MKTKYIQLNGKCVKLKKNKSGKTISIVRDMI